MPALLSLPLAYLLGSIPFGYLLVRTFRKQDIRATGSGNIGATNVARSGAKGLGLLTLLLDLLKGFTAVRIAQHFSPGVSSLALLAAVLAVLGHVFPVWLGFRGGKGVATALGVLLALSPRTTGVILLVFVAVFLLSRYVSLASILAAVALPFAAFFLLPERTPLAIAVFLSLPVLIVVKHAANIERLRLGTESRFGTKSAAAAKPEVTA